MNGRALPNRSLATFVAALLAAVALAGWMGMFCPPISTAPVTDSVARGQPGAVTDGESGSPDPNRTAQQRHDRVNAASPFELLDRADAASAAILALAPQAEGGDTDALMGLNDLLGRCFFLWDEGARVPENDSAQGGDSHRHREQAIKRRRKFCAASGAEVERLADPTANSQDRMEAAAAVGHRTGSPVVLEPQRTR